MCSISSSNYFVGIWLSLPSIRYHKALNFNGTLLTEHREQKIVITLDLFSRQFQITARNKYKNHFFQPEILTKSKKGHIYCFLCILDTIVPHWGIIWPVWEGRHRTRAKQFPCNLTQSQSLAPHSDVLSTARIHPWVQSQSKPWAPLHWTKTIIAFSKKKKKKATHFE